MTPLHRACEEGHLDVARLLLEAGAAVDAEDKVRAALWSDAAWCLALAPPPARVWGGRHWRGWWCDGRARGGVWSEAS